MKGRIVVDLSCRYHHDVTFRDNLEDVNFSIHNLRNIAASRTQFSVSKVSVDILAISKRYILAVPGRQKYDVTIQVAFARELCVYRGNRVLPSYWFLYRYDLSTVSELKRKLSWYTCISEYHRNKSSCRSCRIDASLSTRHSSMCETMVGKHTA